MGKTKKLISVALALLIAFSMTAVSIGNASAIVDEKGCYAPGENVEATHRYYFAMPKDWYSANTNTAGVYWWNGTDACGAVEGTGGTLSWPGYKAQKDDTVKDLYYIDCPTDVPQVVWNNYLDGGKDHTAPIYLEAKQAQDAGTEYYSADDSDLYPTEWFEAMEESFNGDKAALGKFADNFFMEEDFGFGLSFNFDNMVFVIDSTKTSENLEGKKTYVGDWYFYYGEGEYGTYPTKEAAKNNGTLEYLPGYTDPSEPTAPVDPSGKIFFDAKKSGWDMTATKKVYCHIWASDGSLTSSGTAWPAWQSRAELCDFDKSTGIASYELSKTGNYFNSDDGAKYGVIFSANTGAQTYTAVMSGECIGDTLYCTGLRFEHPHAAFDFVEDVRWKNTRLGSARCITSTGNVIGSFHYENESDTTMVADYIISYYYDYYRMDMLEDIVAKLRLSVGVVYEEVLDRTAKLAESGEITAAEKDEIISVAEKYLPLKNLPAPQISIIYNTNDGLLLCWEKVPGAYAYRVYYKNSNGNWVRFGKDTTETRFTDSAVSPGRKETYTVRCVDRYGNLISGYNQSGWSSTYQPKYPELRMRPSVKGMVISWNKIAGVDRYRVYYKNSSGNWVRFKNDVYGTSMIDKGVKYNRKETYTIRCVDKNGNLVSGYKAQGWTVTYTMQSPPPILRNTENGIEISWPKVMDVERYRVYYKNSKGEWTRFKNDVFGTSMIDRGVKIGREETYTIRCLDNDGNIIGGYSKWGVSIKYQPVAPTLSLKNTANGIEISWNKIAGVDRYRVYYKNSSGNWVRFKNDIYGTSMLDKGVKVGRAETYTIRCVDSSGNLASGYNSAGWTITYRK